MSLYGQKRVGSKYSTSFKTYLTRDNKIVSPFHDIPLYADSNNKILNVVNEIPRFEIAKFEISKSLEFNPIVQDTKKGALRFVSNLYPFYGYQCNYGALPQTWEHPDKTDKYCKAKGDNDPLDVIEIGTKRKGVGEVFQAKVLGALGLLDDNETDWKIIIIDIKDEQANKINNIDELNKVYPHIVKDLVWWLKNYKVPTGAKPNEFAMDGKSLSAEFAHKIIEECHANWKGLISDGYEGISCKNSTLENSKEYMEGYKVDGEYNGEELVDDKHKIYSFIANK